MLADLLHFTLDCIHFPDQGEQMGQPFSDHWVVLSKVLPNAYLGEPPSKTARNARAGLPSGRVVWRPPALLTTAPKARSRRFGQKQTSAHVRVMSALPPKADSGYVCWDVRFVPGRAGFASFGVLEDRRCTPKRNPSMLTASSRQLAACIVSSCASALRPA
jgi:hypothetical protein